MLISQFQHALISWRTTSSTDPLVSLNTFIFRTHASIQQQRPRLTRLPLMKFLTKRMSLTRSHYSLARLSGFIHLEVERSNWPTLRLSVDRRFIWSNCDFAESNVTCIRPTPLHESILIDEQFSSPAIWTETCRYATKRYRITSPTPSRFLFLLPPSCVT